MTPICAEVEEEAEANEHIHYDYIEYVKRDESISIHLGHSKSLDEPQKCPQNTFSPSNKNSHFCLFIVKYICLN